MGYKSAPMTQTMANVGLMRSMAEAVARALRIDQVFRASSSPKLGRVSS